jgi:hypothetical protein
LDGLISFTEKEYDHAVSKNIPVLGFVIDDSAQWPKNKMDSDVKKIDLLNKFKWKVKNKIVNLWSSKDELNAKVTVALSKAIIAYPRTGWLKADSLLDASAMNEVARLSKENSDLRKTLKELTEKKVEQLKDEESKVIAILNSHTIDMSYYYKDAEDWSDPFEMDFMKILFTLAPNLMIETSNETAAGYLAVLTKPEKGRAVRDPWPIPMNTLADIFADFRALGLIAPSPKRHALNDTSQYWCLTEKGLAIYNKIRIEKIETEIAHKDTKNLKESVKGLAKRIQKKDSKL